MNRIFCTLCLALAAVFLGSCNTVESRIEKNPLLFGELSSSHRGLVIRGDIKEGMTKDAVFLAWGRPDIVRSSSRSGKAREHWGYTRSTTVASTSFGYGFGGYPHFYSRFGVHPRYGYCIGPGWSHGVTADVAPVIYKEVEFAGDKVVAWERTR